MGRRKAEGPAGIVLVDKAAGWTSHDVVARCRGLLGTRRVGHAGTLDPDATGLLVLGTGRATRLLTFLSGLGKVYTGVAVLGTATSTLDSSGEVTGTWDMADVGLADVRAAAAGLTGAIEQVPPMVSAKKVGGRRLHELAREGVEVERSAVPVTVDRFDVDGPVAAGEFPFVVACSSGTYIRSLVDDLGRVLGGGAHLRSLRRGSVGWFRVDDAVPVEEVSPEVLLPPTAAFPADRWVRIDDEELVSAVRHGQVLASERLLGTGADRGAAGPGPWPVVDRSGVLLAVYVEHRNGAVKPGVVLAAG